MYCINFVVTSILLYTRVNELFKKKNGLGQKKNTRMSDTEDEAEYAEIDDGAVVDTAVVIAALPRTSNSVRFFSDSCVSIH